MPADPSIYGLARPVDLVGGFFEGYKLGDMYKKSKLKEKDRQDLKNAYSNLPKTTLGPFGGDRGLSRSEQDQFILNNLAGMQNNPILARKLETKYNNDKYKREQNMIKTNIARADLNARYYGNVGGQDDLDNVNKKLDALGLTDSQTLRNYSKKGIDNIIYQGSSERDKFNMALRESAAGFRQARFDRNEKFRANRNYQTDWAKLADRAVNPSQRRILGVYKKNIDLADALKGVTDAIGVPHGSNPPLHETRAQQIKRFDHATGMQIEEVISQLNRILTGSAPTISGMEHLRPDTIKGIINKLKQKYIGNPTGLGQGGFLSMFLDTVNRERKINILKQRDALRKMGAGYEHLEKRDKNRYDEILQPEPLTYKGLRDPKKVHDPDAYIPWGGGKSSGPIKPKRFKNDEIKWKK